MWLMLEAANDYCLAHNITLVDVLHLGPVAGNVSCFSGEVKPAMSYKYLGFLMSKNMHRLAMQLQIGWGKQCLC